MPFPCHLFQQLSPHAVLQKEQATLNHPMNFSSTTPTITISEANPQPAQASKPCKSSPLKLQPWLECQQMGTISVPFLRGNKSSSPLADCAGPAPAPTSAKCVSSRNLGHWIPAGCSQHLSILTQSSSMCSCLLKQCKTSNMQIAFFFLAYF